MGYRNESRHLAADSTPAGTSRRTAGLRAAGDSAGQFRVVYPAPAGDRAGRGAESLGAGPARRPGGSRPRRGQVLPLVFHTLRRRLCADARAGPSGRRAVLGALPAAAGRAVRFRPGPHFVGLVRRHPAGLFALCLPDAPAVPQHACQAAVEVGDILLGAADVVDVARGREHRGNPTRPEDPGRRDGRVRGRPRGGGGHRRSGRANTCRRQLCRKRRPAKSRSPVSARSRAVLDPTVHRVLPARALDDRHRKADPARRKRAVAASVARRRAEGRPADRRCRGLADARPGHDGAVDTGGRRHDAHVGRQRIRPAGLPVGGHAGLAAAGRMALTNYLLQSLFWTWVFFGYGLGLWGEVPRTAQVALAPVFFAVQVLISGWWLKRFRFGPAEWLWRSLTYWQIQPMRRVPEER